MQDRICQADETSCNARPDHTCGSSAVLTSGDHFQRLHGRGRFSYGTWSFHRELRMRFSFSLNDGWKKLT
jgi:hypothetical protein